MGEAEAEDAEAEHPNGEHDMCPHDTPCPTAEAIDHDAALVVAHDDHTGYSKLCNGVIRFDDGGEILPDGTVTGPCRGPALHAQVEVADMRAKLSEARADILTSRLATVQRKLDDTRLELCATQMDTFVEVTRQQSRIAELEEEKAKNWVQAYPHLKFLQDHFAAIGWALSLTLVALVILLG
jgi:hypothetical protein